MGAPQLSQTARSGTADAGRAFLLLTGLCLAFGSWCATQFVAYRLGFPRELGAPAFVLPADLHLAARAALSLCLGGAVLAAAIPAARRFSPALLLVAGVVFVLVRWPVYGPVHFLFWSHAHGARAEFADAFSGGRFVLGLGTFAAFVAVSSIRRHGRLRLPSGSFGTAKWGVGSRLAREPEGLELGRRLEDGAMLRYGGDGHLITVVPTGGGKGVSAVVPTLLHYPGSILVPDVKPELYAITARRRREMGHKVVCIDGWNEVGGTDGINPLDFIDPDSPDALDDAEMVADMCVAAAEQHSKERHWTEESLALITGIVLHVKTTAPPELQNLPQVRRLIMLPRGTPEEPGAFEELLAEMMENPLINNLISQRAAALTQKSGDERSGVISSAQQHTRFLDSPRVQKVLSRTTFDLGELKTGRMTVYVVIPARRLSRYARLFRLVLGSALTRISTIPGKPRHKILVIGEEFVQLGRLRPAEEAFRLLRGFGVQFWIFIQDFAAFEELYPKSWRSFLANAGVLQAFNVNDWYTAEELSKRAGETTVFVESESRSRGVSRGRTPNEQEGSGQTTSEKGRRLIFAHEVLTTDPDEELQLLFVQGSDPMLARRLMYYKDEAYRGQFDLNPHHLEVGA
ncbi:MAG TPA: type IV secretory system conjugative DNA transfer family protein [Longimicrobiaceae bacterium]|nr:type IV secretory system conjugative DNA transfer family protein [Longimicrobiaceae bacterium]